MRVRNRRSSRYWHLPSLVNQSYRRYILHYIYIYTTPTYKNNNWFKVGQTKNDPRKRMSQQDGESNPEPLILVGFWGIDNNITDKDIHKSLLNFGFSKVRKSREWFELSANPIQDIEMSIKSFLKTDLLTIAPETEHIPVLNYTEMWWFNSK